MAPLLLIQINKFFEWFWMIDESLMNDTTKTGKPEQDERIVGSLKTDEDRDTSQPAASEPSNNNEDGDLKEKRSRNAGLSEEFFLSDLSRD